MNVSRAKSSLVGGVSSPVRSFHAVEMEPLILVEGRGAKVKDLEGREFFDFIMGYGAIILGHAHPEVKEAVKQAIDNGSVLGTTNPKEIELAELINEAFGTELLRFLNSGTEACMCAIRLARAYTGRKTIVAFRECYHGHSDIICKTEGIPEELSSLVIRLPYNHIEAVEETFQRIGKDIACVIVEPVAGNSGLILPYPRFLEKLKDITTKSGALLIFDEVITGFRIRFGSASYVKPDIVVLGKIIGGGFPVGAVAGPRKIMSLLAPEGPVFQAGTFSGNPITAAAGLKTLEILRRDNHYRALKDTTKRISKEISSFLHKHEVEHNIVDEIGMFWISSPEYTRVFNLLFENGILIPPSPTEVCFVSLAHIESQSNIISALT